MLDSSIVNEVIRTILSLVINFFLRKNFERKKKHQNAKQTISTLLEIFVQANIVAFVVLYLLIFVLLVHFGLIYVFMHLKSFCKKKNKQTQNYPDSLIYYTTGVYPS